MSRATATPATILIADDDDATRAWLASILGQEGYRTETVANARQAAERLHADPPINLLILDMLMEEYDGWWFLRERQTNAVSATVPVLIMTGGIVTRAWAMTHGAVGFIKKPINADELLTEVRRCL